MRYHVLHIKTAFAEEWQKDLFAQDLCDLGVDTIDGDDYYIPSNLWQQHQNAIEEYIHTAISDSQFSVSELPDKNWNAVWESEHPVQELPLGVRIIPHCAFGAGYHETTAMMIDALLNHQSSFEHRTFVNILDHGTGTGVLAIFAKKLGSHYVLALDIDEKSVENAKENAMLNSVDIDVRLNGELSTITNHRSPTTSFHLILANIHRNVLLANMPSYTHLLAPDGQLWVSGFYEQDCPALISAANNNGLTLMPKGTHKKGDWRMLQFIKS